ncbi:MAG: cytidine deaminase [Candidatus Eisenbacteria bacterium]|nr:cytidine deaminase [Candidatus Eisenbacteria bacterium]
MRDADLVKLAKKAMANSYSPYSRFRVGAALLTKSGKVYTGCNVENASLGLSICAERTAIFSAVSDGERDFRSLAIVNSTDQAVFPCGACRQVMREFSGDLKVIIGASRGKARTFKISGLLPFAFESGKLPIGRMRGRRKSSR